MDISRRALLRSTAVGGAAALAGCSLNPFRESEPPDPIASIGGESPEQVCLSELTAKAYISRAEEATASPTEEAGPILRVTGVFPWWHTG